MGAAEAGWRALLAYDGAEFAGAAPANKARLPVPASVFRSSSPSNGHLMAGFPHRRRHPRAGRVQLCLPGRRGKLDAGDYSVDGYENVVAVERKSLADFVHTVIHDFDRFAVELAKLRRSLPRAWWSKPTGPRPAWPPQRRSSIGCSASGPGNGHSHHAELARARLLVRLPPGGLRLHRRIPALVRAVVTNSKETYA